MFARLPQGERTRLIEVAKRRATKHSPRAGGWCPQCKLKDCEPYQTARRFLETYSYAPEPIVRFNR